MEPLKQVIKRNGKVVPFEAARIERAIGKAAEASGETLDAKGLTGKITDRLSDTFTLGKLPHVEDIQDLVEKTLLQEGYAQVAKAYILYRKQRSEIRAEKHFLGVTDDIKVGVNAAKVLAQRYLRKDEEGKIVETPSQLFRRVAETVAAADLAFDGHETDVSLTIERFYNAMSSFEFLPNSPTLMNAGLPLGQLAACFVLPVEDSVDAIFSAVKEMALIHQTGGGTGFSFSRLRPKGDIVRSTAGIASGPVSFMRVFDVATDVIKQGGRRRGANMAILRYDHPDVVDFITAKQGDGQLGNFNFSLAVDDEFMRKAQKGEDFDLINPRTGKSVRSINARYLWDLIITMAWSSGDPGLFFLDTANAANPTPQLGRFESTNPCGEVPLLPYEPCNLGSVNLSKIVERTAGKPWGGNNASIDWHKLADMIKTAVHFLDNVIDASKYPMERISEMAKKNRKIGLGVMGWADMLLLLGIPYDSEQALDLADKIMAFISEEARKASTELAALRGSFPAFNYSKWSGKGQQAVRNATITTIAPTGTISIIANASSGIEPLFALSYAREVMEGTTLIEINPIFESLAKEQGFYSREMMMEIAKTGSIQEFKEISADIRKVFVTSMDIEPEWHVKHQAVFQKHVDNAVSKTVNLPETASLDDIRRIYTMAWEMKCKGITIYRYGSKREQVLYIGPRHQEKKAVETPVTVESEYSGGCAWGYCPL